MASGICCKSLPLPAAVDLQAAARYFGAGAGDAAAGDLLERLAPEILCAAAPRAVWAAFDFADAPGLFAGGDVAAHLAGCERFVLLGMTLGTGVDRAVRRCAVGDVAAGAAADALASALAEQTANTVSSMIAEIYKGEGFFVTGRYSPGYGDWPLAAQKQIGALLDLPKHLGVSVTDRCLLLPRKSITAVVGLAKTPVTGRLAGCETCALRAKCELRKRGNFCGRANPFENG